MTDNDVDERNLFRIAFKAAFPDPAKRPSLELMDGGLELIQYLRGKNSDELPGLIFLDLNMPGLNGYDVIKEIKADPVMKNIEIIIFTTSDSETDRTFSRKQGVRDYVEKPYDFKKWPEIIRNACLEVKE